MVLTDLFTRFIDGSKVNQITEYLIGQLYFFYVGAHLPNCNPTYCLCVHVLFRARTRLQRAMSTLLSISRLSQHMFSFLFSFFCEMLADDHM